MKNSRLAAFSVLMRDATMIRVAIAFAGFSMAFYGGTITILVYAYDRGGVSEASLVGLLFVLPTVIAAPIVAYAGDRLRRDQVATVGYLAQTLVCGAMAAAMLTDTHAVVVYVGAALWNIAMSISRPSLGSLLPLLSETPELLTSANVGLGLIEALGAIAGPALAGVLMAIYSPGVAFATFAVIMAIATITQATVRISDNLAAIPERSPRISVRSELVAGLTFLGRNRDQRLIVSLVGLVWIVIGALDVAFAAVAVELLDSDESAAGFMSMAIGIGGLIGASASVLLIGRRRLTPAIVVGGLLMLLPVIGVVQAPGLWFALLALIVLGVGYRLTIVAGRTLLQGTTPDDVLTRIFGVLEGLNMLAVALGALLVLVLEPLIGLSLTLVLAGLIYPVAVIARSRRLAEIDAARPQLDQGLIDLLRDIPIFAPLSAYQLEQLALNAALTRVVVDEEIVAEGESGDTAYVVSSGRVRIEKSGEPIAEAGPGDYFGEIALLRDVPRTATVTALETVEVYEFRRDVFLGAVTGHRRAFAAATDTMNRRGR
jgi:MFS family permease